MQIPPGSAICRRLCIDVFPFKQTGHRSSKAEQQVATNPRPQLPEKVLKGPDLENGKTRISHCYKPKLTKVSEVPLSKPDFLVQPLHSYHVVHYSGKGGLIGGPELQ